MRSERVLRAADLVWYCAGFYQRIACPPMAVWLGPGEGAGLYEQDTLRGRAEVVFHMRLGLFAC